MKINLTTLAAGVFSLLAAIGSETTHAESAPHGADLLIAARRSVFQSDNATPSEPRKVLTFQKPGTYSIVSQAVFQIDDPTQFVSLTLNKPLRFNNLTLNGKPVPKPMPDMMYTTLPGIPVALLNKGPNTLQFTRTQRVGTRTDKETGKTVQVPSQIDAKDMDIQLFGLRPADCAFQTGPILGYAGKRFFTVSCRVNMPVEVTLEVNNRQYVSKPALVHSFKAVGLTAGTEYAYTLTARLSDPGDGLATLGPYVVRTLPAAPPFVFCVLGDSRTYPKDWAKVATAVVAAKPAFSVFVGDMVTSGRNDDLWDDQYFGPAKDFFATIPYYSVIGNHEQNAQLLARIFPTPGGGNWSQKIGSTLLIGIDGAMDWSRGGELAQWLEGLLAHSDAAFIFLASHYPAWSSGGHGRLNNDGRPREKSIRLAQDVIMPLLKKYNASAMFAGHDHFYERSEPEGGVSVIITGGAGAPLRDKVKNAAKQNPYSKVFTKDHHYCLLKVEGDVCTMTVFTSAGVVIDTRSWAARK